MNYVFFLVNSAHSALLCWSPMQLLAAAAVTVALGYLGIMARLAVR
jgi:hypothetical protein